MVDHQPEAVGPGHRRDPADRAAAGRLRPLGAAQVARWRRTRWRDATAYASEQIGAIRTLQAFTNEKLVTGRFARAVETAFEAARVVGARPRAADLLRHLHDLRLGRGGAVVRLARRARRHACRPARSASSCSIRCSPPARSARCRRSGANLAQAAGAAERLTEILAEKPAIAAPANPTPLPAQAAGAVAFRRRVLLLSGAARPCRRCTV